MIGYNGYPVSIFFAITLHALVLAGLIYLQMEREPEVMDIVRPTLVKALMVGENPQLKNERLLEQQRLVRLDDQRKAREEEQRRQQVQAETQRRELQEKAAEEKKEVEAVALRERQVKERQQADKLKQEREREAERQATERKKQQELAAEQERQKQAEAAAATASSEVATTESELVQSYSALIHDLVKSNWSRPPSARNGMVAVLRIRMLPSGDVQSVEVERSSGDAAFDRAAEAAVFRVGRFRELQGMPINLFNTSFRTFLLTFKPEDLLN